MKDITQSGDGNRFKGQYNLVVENSTSEEIPAYGVMRVSDTTDVGTNRVFTVAKPNGSTNVTHVLNGPVAIAANGRGAAIRAVSPQIAAYTGSPTAGQEWGPVNNSWLLQSTGTGFLILGGEAGGLVHVTELGGGGGTSNLRWGRVYGGDIAAAASNLAADWETGGVKFMDDATGELDAEPTEVVNKWIGTSWVEDAQVCVDTGQDPPVIVDGTCGAVTWDEE